MKNILLKAATLLQLTSTTEFLEEGKLPATGTKIVSEEDTPQEVADNVNSLVRCVNLVASELATSYIRLVAREQLASHDCVIGFDRLQKAILEPIAVYYGDNKVDAQFSMTSVAVPKEGSYQIEYLYLPDYMGFGDSLMLGRVTPTMVAYGVCCEYCIINGLQEDAILWDNRYKNSLEMLESHVPRQIKRRRWL